MSDRFYLGGDAPAWADGHAHTGRELRQRMRDVGACPPLKLWIRAGVPSAEMADLFPEDEYPRFEDFGRVQVGDVVLQTCERAELERVWRASDGGAGSE